jgi:hypothetical protein
VGFPQQGQEKLMLEEFKTFAMRGNVSSILPWA